MKNFQQSLWFLVLVSVLLFLVKWVFSMFAPESWVSPHLFFIVPFFLVVAVLSRWLLHNIKDTSGTKTSQAYIALTGSKFFLYLTILLIYGRVYDEGVKLFFLSFLVVYLFFMFIDTRSMVVNVKK